MNNFLIAAVAALASILLFNFTVTQTGGSGPGCDCKLEEIGPKTWKYMHDFTDDYPDKPNEFDKTQAIALFEEIANTFPCRECRFHFKEEMLLEPPRVESRCQLNAWLCRAHNKVNVRLNKRVRPCNTCV
jgi:hypothetical protein